MTARASSVSLKFVDILSIKVEIDGAREDIYSQIFRLDHQIQIY